MIEIKDKKNRSIFVVDDALDYNEQNYIYTHIINSSFKIGFEDTSALERLSHKFLHSAWTPEDLYQSKFRYALEKTKLWDKVKELEVSRITINLSVPSDTYFPHCHNNELALIYYANLDWKAEWGGETLFYDDNLKDIIFASAYIPGRIILSDGEIPHSIKAQSHIAPHYRFSLAIFFKK
jgi:hypothetical protein